MGGRGQYWGRIHRGLSLVLTVVWLGAGATKLAGLNAFQGVLEAHGVLPDRVIRQAWVLPVVEVLIGTGLFVGGGRPLRPRVLVAAAVASAALLLGFSAYILRVDPEVLKTAGCGCAAGLADLIDSPTRGGVVAVDAVLLALSIATLRVPKAAPAK
jgi:hypothetical protein